MGSNPTGTTKKKSMEYNTENMEYTRGKLESEIDKFLESKYRNVWLIADPVRVYVRKSQRLLDGKNVKSFDMANVEVDPEYWRRGCMKMTIETILRKSAENGFDIVYVESVLNKHVSEYLRSLPGWERFGKEDEFNINFIHRNNV